MLRAAHKPEDRLLIAQSLFQDGQALRRFGFNGEAIGLSTQPAIPQRGTTRAGARRLLRLLEKRQNAPDDWHMLATPASFEAINKPQVPEEVTSVNWSSLQLAIDDLRQVALPVPEGGSLQRGHPTRLARMFAKSSPSGRALSSDTGSLSERIGGRLLSGRYLATKQALGRAYENETRTLLHWDGFLYHHQGRSRKISSDSFNGWAAQLTQGPRAQETKHGIHRRSECPSEPSPDQVSTNLCNSTRTDFFSSTRGFCHPHSQAWLAFHVALSKNTQRSE